MSSAVISTSAALSRPFLFDDEPEPDVCLATESKRPARVQASQEAILASVAQSKIGHRQSALPLAPASRLAIRPAPDMASIGIPALDVLTGGLPRGCLTEICGSASSGRTTVLLAALAAATRRGEFCALIDASDSLDPHSAISAGVDPDRLLWVRCSDIQQKNSPRRHSDTEKSKNSEKENEDSCPTLLPRSLRERVGTSGPPILAAQFAGKSGTSSKSAPAHDRAKSSEHRLEQVLRATDLLLESGGFGLIVLDLADISQQWARRIPLTTWFRFRRAVEHKSTMLVSVAQQPIAGSCSSLLLQLGEQKISEQQMDDAPSHSQLLIQLQIHVEPIRSRLERKPSHSISFESKTAWAG